MSRTCLHGWLSAGSALPVALVVPIAALLVPIAALLVPIAASASGGYGSKLPVDRVEKRAKTTLPPVVVTPGRAAQTAFESDRTVRSISREKVARLQAQTAAEALHETPGVMVQKTNRGAGAPFLRGLVGPRNLLVVDGVRFSNSTFRTGPNQYLQLLDPSAALGYEVLMGPASVVYGSDAMGGVIALRPFKVPRRGKVRRAGTAHAIAGLRLASADRSMSVNGTVGARSGAFGVRAGGAVRRFGELMVGGGTAVPVSEYVVGAWHLRTRYDISERSWLGATWLGARIRDAGRTDRLSLGDFRLYDNDSDIGWLEFRHRAVAGLLQSARVLVSLHRTAEDVERFDCAPGQPGAASGAGAAGAAANSKTLSSAEQQACVDGALPARHLDVPTPSGAVERQGHARDTVMTPGFLVLLKLRLPGALRGTLGAEGHRDTVGSTSRERRLSGGWKWTEQARGNFSAGSTYTSAGAFALVSADLYDGKPGKLVLRGGARLAYFAALAQDVPGFGAVRYNSLGAVATAGLRWQAQQAWTAWLNVSQGLRAPNLQETTVLGDTGSKFEVPNGDLAPELSIAVELGARVRLRRLQIGAVAFANLLDGTIDERELTTDEWQALGVRAEDVGARPVVQRVNSGSGQFFGGEVSLDVSLTANLSSQLRGSYITGRIDRATGAVPSRRSPPPMGAAALRYRVPGVPALQIELFTRFAGAATALHPSDEKDLRICEDPGQPGTTYKDSGETCPGTPGWATANVRAVYKLGKNLRFDLAALNLLDANYKYHGSGLAEPGRGLALSVAGRL